MFIISRFFRGRRGSTSIEFALTVVFFLFLIFFTAEMSRMAYLSSALDLAISEAAKDAKNDQAVKAEDYQSRFNLRLLNRGGSLWGFLNRSGGAKVSIFYSDSIETMLSTGGNTTNSEKNTLARYQVQYQYHPMFFPFPQGWVNTLFNREVIFVQEYERSKFMD